MVGFENKYMYHGKDKLLNMDLVAKVAFQIINF